MVIEKRRIGEILVERGLITQGQLSEALEVQRMTPAPLGSILAHLGYVDEEVVVSTMAEEHGVRPWNLKQNPPDPAAVAKLPADVSRSYRILPVAMQGDVLLLAMANPEDIEALDFVRYTTRMRIEAVLTSRHRLLQAIKDFHGGEGSNELDQLVVRAVQRVEKAQDTSTPSQDAVESVPVVSLVNQIIHDAIRMGASDVHIEPHRGQIDVRYRVDGQMRKASELPVTLLGPITIRIKIMAEMDIVEQRVPMDGRLSIPVQNRDVDMRVSILPSAHGSRIALRILDKAHSFRKLEDLGFAGKSLRLIRDQVARPYGLFLVTGPAGSGKTSTAYASLVELRDATINVMTCEDPIEYDIDGISQSQTNESVGLTYERQILALLRQDPDVILVGEMQDEATAHAAVRAALTGHMVVSTLQCNNAPGAIPRLVDLGLDPYLLSTAINGIVSQRLLRTLCSHCAKMRPTMEDEARLFLAHGTPAPSEVPQAVGCPSCMNLGFRGRSTICEIMVVTSEVAKLIAAHESVELLRDAASKAGFVPMQSQALEMVMRGATTLEEVQRTVALEYDYGAKRPR